MRERERGEGRKEAGRNGDTFLCPFTVPVPGPASDPPVRARVSESAQHKHGTSSLKASPSSLLLSSFPSLPSPLLPSLPLSLPSSLPLPVVFAWRNKTLAMRFRHLLIALRGRSGEHPSENDSNTQFMCVLFHQTGGGWRPCRR